MPPPQHVLPPAPARPAYCCPALTDALRCSWGWWWPKIIIWICARQQCDRQKYIKQRDGRSSSSSSQSGSGIHSSSSNSKQREKSLRIMLLIIKNEQHLLANLYLCSSHIFTPAPARPGALICHLHVPCRGVRSQRAGANAPSAVTTPAAVAVTAAAAPSHSLRWIWTFDV